jgi:uncharacterized protein (TIGR03663 family)
VGTASTKSGHRKKGKKASARHRAETQDFRRVSEPFFKDTFPERAWRIGVISIFVIAAVLRLYDLSLVPLHHDEGVNGNFLVRLVREGAYQYDPENYHGPTLYYFAAIIPWVTRLLFGSAARDNYGLTTFTVRLIPVIFGLATIGLVFLLRRKLGTVGTLSAALMLAVSPGAIYLSRYFIHETLFVFFTLGIVVAALWVYEKRNLSYLIPAAACTALLFATKETAMISAGVLIIALAVGLVYMRLYRSLFGQSAGRRDRTPNGLSVLIREMGGASTVIGCIVISLIVFQVVYLLFYSSFLQNYKGIYDSLQTFAVWTKTGKAAHVHPPYQYIEWLFRQEKALLFLGTVGATIVVLRPRSFFALFSALWAFGLTAAYSLIPYKTPWLLLNFIVPLALIAGYALQTIYELDGGQLRLVSVILLIAISVSTYQSIDLNFINYDNDKPQYVYVYAHTKRGMLELVDEIERISQDQGGRLTGITIVSPDYWPLPWYLRNYTRVGYFGRMAASTEPLIIANENQKAEIEANYGELYQQVPSKQANGTFELRPGVNLLLYRRRTGFTPASNPPA